MLNAPLNALSMRPQTHPRTRPQRALKCTFKCALNISNAFPQRALDVPSNVPSNHSDASP